MLRKTPIASEAEHKDFGSQFTSEDFIEPLESADILISMNGRGRVYDNIFMERIWRSVKYMEVYLHKYRSVAEARKGITRYFIFYNMERLHEFLGYRTPYEVYVKDDRSYIPER